MIIETEKDVTKAVLAELAKAPNPRFREVMSAFVRHLHDFAREVKLTEEEFREAMAYIVKLGQVSNETHNEAVLISGSLGFSQLVVHAQQRRQRPDGDRREPARAVLAHAFAGDAERRLDRALADARRGDVRERLVQGPRRPADRGRRGRHLALLDRRLLREPGPGAGRHEPARQVQTDADGHISFRSVKPAGYPIPIDGPIGDLLRAQGRHNMRPAHLHFLAAKDGFKTLISQIYVQDDKFLETDVQFGVTRRLVGNYVRHENETPPAPDVNGPWYSLDYTFVMEDGATKLPRPPITGKAKGERPNIPHLA